MYLFVKKGSVFVDVSNYSKDKLEKTKKYYNDIVCSETILLCTGEQL